MEVKLRTYQHQVDFKTASGWTLEDAEAHVALSGVCCVAISKGLAEELPTFAASTHALCNALARAAKLQHDVPGVQYTPIYGVNGLANQVDRRFGSLLTPDSLGFLGFTCTGEAYMYDPVSELFPGDGLPPRERRTQQGKVSYPPLPPDAPSNDVIAFISRAEDDAGLHSTVRTR